MAIDDRPAVVLAAGEGRRLEPLTDTRPKPMLPVANRPILAYVLEAIADAGLTEVVLVVGYRQERIRTHFGDGDDWGLDIAYVEQAPQLGTGHALLQAEDALEGPFLVFNGDRIVEASVAGAVADAHAEGDAAVAVTVAHHPSTFGVVDVEGDRLVGVEEKPLDPSPRATINAGVYAFDGSVFDELRAVDPVDGEQTLTAALDAMAREGRVAAVPYDGRWLDVTHLWDLPAVNGRLVADAPAPAAGSAQVADSAAIATDVALGADVRVGANAAVGGGTALGRASTVGAGAVVENAVVLDDATVAPGAVVRDAVVGANAVVGPNATIGGGDGTVVLGGAVHEGVTLGGVVGDNARVGGGASLEAGTVVGTGAVLAAGVAVGGWVPRDAEVRRG